MRGKVGRTLGFPTANLFIEEIYKLIPGDGIYAVLVEIEDELDAASLKPEPAGPEPGSSEFRLPTDHTAVRPPDLKKGMGYIGSRPTLNGMTRNIEVNIFDFAGDIYNKKITLHFLHFVRHDKKFTSLADLKTQLAKDEITTRKLIG